MKKSISILICSLISIQLWADEEVDKIIAQVHELSSQKCIGEATQKTSDSREVQIGFLRGSPVDAFNAPQAGEDYLEISRKLLEKQGYKVKTQSGHHTGWEKMCNEFKKNPQARVVLVGHSYGTSGVLKVANCLQLSKIETELLISVSSFDFLAGVDISKMPAHVKNNLNFPVSDPLIPGYREHTAIDPASTRVENIKASVLAPSPHIQAVGKLLPLLGLATVAQIEGKYGCVQTGGKVSNKQVYENLSSVWKSAAEEEVVAVQEPERAAVNKYLTEDEDSSDE